MGGQALSIGIVMCLAAGLAVHGAWRAAMGGLDATVVVEAACGAALVAPSARMAKGVGTDE